MSVTPLYAQVRDLLREYREGRRSVRARIPGDILLGIKPLDGVEKRGAAAGLREAISARGRTPVALDQECAV